MHVTGSDAFPGARESLSSLRCLFWSKEQGGLHAIGRKNEWQAGLAARICQRAGIGQWSLCLWTISLDMRFGHRTGKMA